MSETSTNNIRSQSAGNHQAEAARHSKSNYRIRLISLGSLLIFFIIVIASQQSIRTITSGGKGVALDVCTKLVSHAGIGMPEATYSNSLEALELSVARGFTAIELDFEMTSDGILVGAHDWGQTYRELNPVTSRLSQVLGSFTLEKAPTHAEFMARRLRGNLTPVDLPLLATWLKSHSDVALVTDVKVSNVDALAAMLDAGLPHSQIVPQIYSRDEFDQVRALGFKRIIYTLYKDTSVPMSEIIAFAREKKVDVTIHSARVSRKLVRSFHNANVPLYVHTINDPRIASTLVKWGVTGLYTDFLFGSECKDDFLLQSHTI